MTGKVKVDDSFLVHLWREQAFHLAETLVGNDYATADDGGDYISSALDVATTLFDWVFQGESNTAACEQWLNTPQGHDEDVTGYLVIGGRKVTALGLHASDGICEALYELDCPALPKERV